MATAIFKVEEKGELTEAEAVRALAGAAQEILRIDVRGGKTTIFFAADKADKGAAKALKRASEVKPSDLATL